LDAIVFTGGIGEHASTIRERACEGLEHLGIAIDLSKNEAVQGDLVADIARDGSPVRALVVHTEEGREIAMQTVCTIHQAGK